MKIKVTEYQKKYQIELDRNDKSYIIQKTSNQLRHQVQDLKTQLESQSLIIGEMKARDQRLYVRLQNLAEHLKLENLKVQDELQSKIQKYVDQIHYQKQLIANYTEKFGAAKQELQRQIDINEKEKIVYVQELNKHQIQQQQQKELIQQFRQKEKLIDVQQGLVEKRNLYLNTVVQEQQYQIEQLKEQLLDKKHYYNFDR